MRQGGISADHRNWHFPSTLFSHSLAADHKACSIISAQWQTQHWSLAETTKRGVWESERVSPVKQINKLHQLMTFFCDEGRECFVYPKSRNQRKTTTNRNTSVNQKEEQKLQWLMLLEATERVGESVREWPARGETNPKTGL